jgi:hypothetical protein
MNLGLYTVKLEFVPHFPAVCVGRQK